MEGRWQVWQQLSWLPWWCSDSLKREARQLKLMMIARWNKGEKAAQTFSVESSCRVTESGEYLPLLPDVKYMQLYVPQEIVPGFVGQEKAAQAAMVHPHHADIPTCMHWISNQGVSPLCLKVPNWVKRHNCWIAAIVTVDLWLLAFSWWKNT